MFNVVDVKSLTSANETRQMRLGIGQVLDYRELLTGAYERIRGVIVVERRPSDPRWARLCASLGISLVWPEVFDGLR